LVWFMMFYATLKNISVTSWRSDLLVEETGEYLEKTTDLQQVTDKQHPFLNIHSVTFSFIISAKYINIMCLKIVQQTPIYL
jgi:hypothetical protein